MCRMLLVRLNVIRHVHTGQLERMRRDPGFFKYPSDLGSQLDSLPNLRI